jgi:NAD+ kinase
VLVALGGDGFLLRIMHRPLALARPIFGMNRGTVGFLLNEFRAEGLVERISGSSKLIGVGTCAHSLCGDVV